MIYVESLLRVLKKNNINFFVGVPDSVLKSLSNYLTKVKNHIIASNEGAAISIATGYHLSKSKIPCIYMQNSGLGNAINPLLSVTHKNVYSIPLILIIGWRGAPGISDEPQHIVTGKITRQILKTLGIKYCVIDKKKDLMKFNQLIKFARLNKTPVACLIKNKKLTSKIKNPNKKLNNNLPNKNDVISALLYTINDKTLIVSTTGYTSRELNKLRRDNKILKGKDFYMIGGMGHTSSVSLGVSLYKKKNNIICLDGDGSLIMHMGSLVTNGFYGKKNFKHILLNNYSHESVGGQKTNSENVNFKKLALSVGYKNYSIINNKNNLKKKLLLFQKKDGPSFLEIKIKQGSTKNLDRPKNFLKIKESFMK